MQRLGTRLLAASMVLGLIAVGAAPAGAQEDERDCDCVERGWTRMHRGLAPLLDEAGIWLDRRARLGVVVETGIEDGDTVGARVRRVLTDGPAAEAGLEEGDIIVSFNGERLADSDESPARRLVSLARDLESGDTVTLEYRRDGELRTATVVAEDLPGPPALRVEAAMPPMRALRMRELAERMGDLPRVIEFSMRGAWFGLDLAELNPDLGAYFGTEDGVLVLSVDSEELGLRAGDVIRAIDTREVETPRDVRRILRSYDPGEEITFRVFRDRSETTVTGEAPESGSPRSLER